MKITHTRRTLRKAFSLLEITLVVVIMGILLTVVATNVLGQGDKAKRNATKLGLENVNGALKQYQLEYSSPPNDLQAMVNMKLVEAGKLKDAWGTPYQYDPRPDLGGPDRPWTFFSSGADKTAGTQDDINVWTMTQGG
jgi:general secretion pathway protein G